ncbi:MAG: hypothetical protein AAGE96_02160 [Cyanobacteria bacterium P01_G01_bin.19]
MEVLLESLTGFGFLQQKSDRYQLTKTALDNYFKTIALETN